MTVECVTCARFTLRGVDLARHGFGACTVPTTRPEKAALFVSPSYPRECNSHRPAEADIVQARKEWLSKPKKK